MEKLSEIGPVAKILIIEDDLVLTATISEFLVSEGHKVESVTNGGDGLQLLKYSGFDLALIDWQLPEMTGIEICHQFRQAGGQTPILMMTQKSAFVEKAEGLDSGADDYLAKPFSLIEFGARIRALLRRSSVFTSTAVAVGKVRLDYQNCILNIGDRVVKLVPREFDVLEFLFRNRHNFVTSEKIISHVWDSDASVTSEALRTCINRIRRKVDLKNESSIIDSSRGLGYRISEIYLQASEPGE